MVNAGERQGPAPIPGEFILRDKVSGLWQFRWVIVLFTLLGLAGGWLVHLAKPPVYDAQAIFNARIDYKKLDHMVAPSYEVPPNSFTTYDEDLSLIILDASFRSVAPQVADYARQNGFPIDAAGLLDRVTIERQEWTYKLHFLSTDPALAQKVATAWARMGYADLQSKQRDGQFPDYVSVQPAQPVSFPQKPVYFRTLNMVLAGGVIGLAAGILFLHLPFPKMKMER